jgi:hypothetical protein
VSRASDVAAERYALIVNSLMLQDMGHAGQEEDVSAAAARKEAVCDPAHQRLGCSGVS